MAPARKGQGAAKARSMREQRLEAELRANLKRRKDQVRARAVTAAERTDPVAAAASGTDPVFDGN